jgi:hypothetical protein
MTDQSFMLRASMLRVPVTLALVIALGIAIPAGQAGAAENSLGPPIRYLKAP